MYINGAHVDSDQTGWNPDGGFPGQNTGVVVLGRKYSGIDDFYADVSVDELYYWEEPLGGAQIAELYNWYP